MTAETIQATDRHVNCLFCGTRNSAPSPKPSSRSNRFADANFRVSIVRCRVCGKEAPYQVSSPDIYQEHAKAASAD